MEKSTLSPNTNSKALPSEELISVLDIGEENVERSDDKKKRGAGGRSGVWGVYQRLNEKVQSITTIGIRDKVTFFQLLSVMIEAGVPLVRSLYVLSQQTTNGRMRKIVATLAQKVETGKPLSAAMQDFYGIFNDAQIGMVRAGEISGRLNEILQEIAIEVEKTAKLMGKVKGAMIYPIVVLTLMFGSVFVILTYVVPQLMGLFSETGTALPPSTQILLGVSAFTDAHAKTILGTAIVAAGLFYLWKHTAMGKYHWHAITLHMPLFGVLIRYMALSRLTRTLGSLLQSGVPIVKSLQIDADAVGNEVYRRRLYMAAEDVSRGIPLGEHLTDSPFLFPEMVVSMVGVGEQTAELPKICHKIADFYDNAVDQMAANLSKLMEPFILLMMGTIVGGLIMAVMQPIFSLMDVVGNL
jgi:type IV pilus assembly protein PilC